MAGTQELVPGVTIASSPYGTTVAAFNGGIVYAGTDGGLWESNGTPAGTTELVAPGQSLGAVSGWGDVYAGSTQAFGYGNFDPVGFADVGGTLVFDGTAYGPALDSGTGGVVEPIITFNGSDVQVVGQLGAGSEPPNLNPTEIYLGGQPGNYTSYVVDTPSGLPDVPGTVTDAAFFQAYGYGNGLAYYDPTMGGGGTYYGGPGSYEIIDGQPTSIYENGGPDANDITNVGGVLLFNTETTSGFYDDYTLGLSTGPGADSPFPYVDLASYISGVSANGINPTDITAFDGNAYFNGYDSAGDQGLFELQADSETGFIGVTLSSSPPLGSAPAAGGGYAYIAADGLELTGISGASPDGINPNDLTALNIPAATDVAITVTQLLDNLNDPAANPLPAREGSEGYVLMDSAANIASLSPADIVTGESLGVTAIVTGGTIDVAQAEALEQFVSILPFDNTDSVTVFDTAADIQAMTPAQMSALTEIGVGEISVNDPAIILTAPQATALSLASIQLIVPQGGSIAIDRTDTLTAAAIEDMTQTQADELAAFGYSTLSASDASIVLTVGQALVFENAGFALTAPGYSVTISDIATKIESLTTSELAGLANLGVSGVTATDTSIYLSTAQAEALEDPNVPITALQGKVFVADTAAKIDNLSPAQISTLALIGVNALTGSASEVLTMDLAQAVALEQAGLQIGPPQAGNGLQFAIADSPNAIENLTPQQIAGLRGISPKYFIGEVNASGGFGLGIADTVAFANADIIVTVPSGDTLGVVDTDSDVASLTAAQIDALRSVMFAGRGWITVPADQIPTIYVTSGESPTIDESSLPNSRVTILSSRTTTAAP